MFRENTRNATTQDIVEIVNDQVVVSSRQIAEHFGKEHKDVLYAVREILTAENSAVRFFV